MSKKEPSQTPLAISQRARRAKQLAKGLCTTGGCNNPLSSEVYCQECLYKRREYGKQQDAKNRANGHCRHCPGKLPAPNLSICIDCWWKHKSTSIFGTTKYISGLQKLWEKQEGKCAISGLPLTPGLNASLDHIIPKSMGGPNTIENLQWVLHSINSFKLTHTIDELIEICKAIIEWNYKKLA